MKGFQVCLRARMMRWFDRGRSCEKGVSTVEFALIAPVFIVIIAGIADVGGLLVSRSDVSAAVTAGSNYLLVNADRVASAPEEVARQTAAVAGHRLPAGAVARVTVNGGLTVEHSGGNFSTSGSAVSASQCFCAQVAGASMSLGSALECGTPCESGGYASRYVHVAASHSYSPMFGGFGMTSPDGSVSVNATVNVP